MAAGQKGDEKLPGHSLHADDELADFVDDLLREGLAIGGQFLGGFRTGDGGWGHATRGGKTERMRSG